MSQRAQSILALVLVTLTQTTLSSPVPQSDSSYAANITSDPVPTTLISQCASKGVDTHIEWGVYVANTTMPSNRGSGSWAGGLLDNLRGQKGCKPSSWQALLDNANPQGVGVSFNTGASCQTNQVVHAIYAASSENDQDGFGDGEWVYCAGDTEADRYNATQLELSAAGKALGGLGSVVGAIPGLLSAVFG